MTKIVSEFNGGLPNIRVNIHRDDGSMQLKDLTAVEYFSLLRDVFYEHVTMPAARLGALPDGFYDAAISGTPDSYTCAVCLEPGRVSAIYFDKEYVVPYPKLLLVYKVLRGSLVGTRCFALKRNDVLDDNVKLYKYPFGNVDDDGSVCWGGNSRNLIGERKFNSLHDLNFLSVLFVSSPSNGDYFTPDRINNFAPSLSDFYRELGSMDVFPDECLSPIGGHYNLGSFLNDWRCLL